MASRSWRRDSRTADLWRDDPPFSRRDGWRPLRLVLDDDSLTEEDISTVLAFSDYEEVEVWHTDPNVLPHLELQEPSQDYLPIRKIGEPGVSFSSFGVHLTQHLADRARRLAEETGCDEEIVWRLLVLSAAVDQKQVDGFVTRRRLLLDSRSPGEGTVFTVEEPPFGFFSALAGGFPGTVSRRKGIGSRERGAYPAVPGKARPQTGEMGPLDQGRDPCAHLAAALARPRTRSPLSSSPPDHHTGTATTKIHGDRDILPLACTLG